MITNGIVGDENRNLGVKLDLIPQISVPTVPLPMNCLLATHFHENINFNKAKLNERYERTGDSDIMFGFVSTAGYNPLTNEWINKYDGEYIQTVKRDYSKSEIGSAPR